MAFLNNLNDCGMPDGYDEEILKMDARKTTLALFHSNHYPMKKIKLIHCLLALGIFWSACDPKTSDQGISLTAKEICDPASKDKRGCFPLDDQNAVMITVQDGRPRLHPLPAEAMRSGPGKGFAEMRAQLLRGEKGHRFESNDTRITAEKDALVVRSAAQKEEVRYALSSLENGFVMVFSNGLDETATAEFNLAEGDAACVTQRDITDSIHANICARITVLESVCFGSLGVAEILDNGLDPFLFRIRIKKDWLKEILTPEMTGKLGPDVMFKGVKALSSSKAQPHAAAPGLPLHFANDPAPSRKPNGGCQGLALYAHTVPLCSFHLGNKRLIYCDQALYLADDSKGANKVLLMQLEQGCDLCLTRQGECIAVSKTDLSPDNDIDYCAGRTCDN
jgi:hypothetical protein